MTDRRIILQAWLHAMSRLEYTLQVRQGRARNALVIKAAAAYEAKGSVPGHLFAAYEKRTENELADHYRRCIPVFAKLALSQIKSRRVEQKAAQTIYEALVQEWISREAARKAKLIADTDRDGIVNVISAGMAEGEGIAAIAREIRKVSVLTVARAALIARTETHAAATFGSIESVREAERELGVKMNKEWLATRDNRTREDHLAADGQTVGLDEKFMVGGEPMDRPGDTSASASQTIACRCSMVFVEVE